MTIGEDALVKIDYQVDSDTDYAWTWSQELKVKVKSLRFLLILEENYNANEINDFAHA